MIGSPHTKDSPRRKSRRIIGMEMMRFLLRRSQEIGQVVSLALTRLAKVFA